MRGRLLLFISILFSFFLIFSSPANAQTTWGTITIGTNQVTLENSKLKAVYSMKTYSDGTQDFVISQFINKANSSVNLAGDQLDGLWVSSTTGRGTLTKATVTVDTATQKTVRMEFNSSGYTEDVSMYPDQPFLKMFYTKFGYDVVDIGSASGSYVFYGGAAWQALRQTITDSTLLNNPEADHRLTYTLYPLYPIPIIDTPDWKGLAPTPLSYKNYIIGAVYNSQGYGYGRIWDCAAANHLKLLFNTGFELFPYWTLTPQPFTSYLYVGSGGANALVTTGQTIVDNFGSSSPTPTPTPTSGKPGDANNDNKVDGLDYVIWLNHYNQTISGVNNGNFNSDSKVDGLDYVIWVNNYGK